MKKIVATLLAAIMLLSCMTGMVFAAEAGETVTVEFVSVGNPGFATFGAQINYDAAALELVEIKAGALCQNGLFSGTASTGKVGYVNTNNVTGDGVLFVATFKVKADAVPGTYAVTATLDTKTTANADREKVQFAIVGGEIEVEEAVCEHNWGEWTVTTPATCEEAGEEQRVCSICGEVETRVIPATGHNHDGEWKYDDDSHWHECPCGDIADKAAHEVEWVIVKNPTHNEDGLKQEQCKVCEWTGAEEVIPADPDLDDVPGTGDMTPVFVAAFAVVMGMAAVVVFVFKRKLAI